MESISSTVCTDAEHPCASAPTADIAQGFITVSHTNKPRSEAAQGTDLFPRWLGSPATLGLTFTARWALHKPVRCNGNAMGRARSTRPW